jgi:hypothetical protein
VPLLLALAHKNRRGLAGGAGVKLYPNQLRNLHHWAFGEDRFANIATGQEWRLPSREPGWAYGSDNGL